MFDHSPDSDEAACDCACWASERTERAVLVDSSDVGRDSSESDARADASDSFDIPYDVIPLQVMIKSELLTPNSEEGTSGNFP